MRIALFSDNFYPELSGISDSIIVLANELSRKGHKIRFYVPKYSKSNYQKARVPHKELKLGKNISVVRIPSFPYPGPTKQTRLVVPTGSLKKSLTEFKPEIIHTQGIFGVGLEALIVAKSLGIPLVGTNHTVVTEFLRYSPLKTKWFEHASMSYASWYYNQCDFVTAPSNFIFKEMEKHGLKKAHKTVSNPINDDMFSPVRVSFKDVIRGKFGLSGFVMVYAGRLSAEKHVDVIIRALAQVAKRKKDITLVLAGHGDLTDDLKHLAKKLHVESRVRFFGTLDKATLAKVYQASDLFVMASTAEMQPMSVMQAMACGLPSLGVKSGGLVSLINKNNGLLVEPNNASEMAKRIMFLLKNPGRPCMLRMGAVSFSKQFSSEKIAQEWEKIYNDVLRTGSHG